MCLFWVGQIGIIFDVLGAGYIVIAAYQAYKYLEGKSHTIDAGGLIESTMLEVRGQYKKEVIGFSILAILISVKIERGKFGICFLSEKILAFPPDILSGHNFPPHPG